MADTVRINRMRMRRLLKLTRFLILAFPTEALLFMKQKAYILRNNKKIKLISKKPIKKNESCLFSLDSFLPVR